MRDRIVEAALKRFTHYSASKTTMNEIADDLHCSKASLYYYFPDKHAMHVAVLERVGETFFQELSAVAAAAPTAYDALLEMISVRHRFAKRFCRLELFKILRDRQFSTTDETFRQAREKEAGIIAAAFRRGAAAGELTCDDPEETAMLYIQAMIGLRMALADGTIADDLTDEEFERIRQWQLKLTDVFMKGLKK
ncbi:TetR/AcrR family transcriptional regulator [Chitinophaga lutea]